MAPNAQSLTLRGGVSRSRSLRRSRSHRDGLEGHPYDTVPADRAGLHNGKLRCDEFVLLLWTVSADTLRRSAAAAGELTAAASSVLIPEANVGQTGSSAHWRCYHHHLFAAPPATRSACDVSPTPMGQACPYCIELVTVPEMLHRAGA